VDTARGFDVVVVGGGSAGCVIAARLSEEPDRSVCLLEAGPDYGFRRAGAWPRELVDARVMTDAYDWRDDDSHLGAARVIGGGSAVNACAWLRPPDADLEDWGPDWAPADLHPCFDRVHETLGPRHFEGHELSPWWRAVAYATSEAGIGPGAAPMPLSVHGTERWNAAFAFLDPARERPNLTVLGDTLAERLVVSGERALAVRAIVDGQASEVNAGTVVLCAGSYGSPAVLLRSHLGQGLPIGEGLAEHFGVRIRLEPSDELIAALEQHLEEHDLFLAQGMVRAERPSADDWDLHLLPMLLPTGSSRVEAQAEKPYSLGLTAMLLQPEWRGRVTLASDDPMGIPRATPVAFRGPDLDAAVEALELAREMLATPAGAAAVERELLPGDDAPRGKEARAFLAAETPSRYFHPTGTCALGSVVDAGARVRGFDNLYVADASLIPHPVRAGTNFTVLAVAERVAELIG
jgi:choline dehydrogenase